LKPNYINHIALVLDASTSMDRHSSELIRVADAQIAYLAQRSKELDQETRVSVYTFSYSSSIQCVIFDKDVLRLPSIKEVYHPNGMTALVDATLKSQDDLAKTAQMYGDHAFLTFVLTDGMENDSRHTAVDLEKVLKNQAENWTVAVLVPDMRAKHDAKKFGFPSDNIAVWDPNSSEGINEVGKTIRTATDNFMVSRASGVRGSRSIFSTGIDAVNKQTLKEAGLKPLPLDAYAVINVKKDGPIRETVEANGLVYKLGIAYYQLTKTETIQPQKAIAIRNRHSGRYHVGQNARDLLGLGGDAVRVKPEHNPEFDIFVQSTSVNRKLIAGTRLLVLK
jgi:hypothetical protein